MEHTLQNAPLNILLADDDEDEQYFFEIAFKESPIGTNLNTVYDGVYLMEYLNQHLESLPDVIFLDINMPRKSGLECLIEIKSNEKLKLIPIVVYSSCDSADNIVAYYEHGACSFLQKGHYTELIQCIQNVLNIGEIIHQPILS